MSFNRPGVKTLAASFNFCDVDSIICFGKGKLVLQTFFRTNILFYNKKSCVNHVFEGVSLSIENNIIMTYEIRVSISFT